MTKRLGSLMQVVAMIDEGVWVAFCNYADTLNESPDLVLENLMTQVV